MDTNRIVVHDAGAAVAQLRAAQADTNWMSTDPAHLAYRQAPDPIRALLDQWGATNYSRGTSTAIVATNHSRLPPTGDIGTDQTLCINPGAVIAGLLSAMAPIMMLVLVFNQNALTKQRALGKTLDEIHRRYQSTTPKSTPHYPCLESKRLPPDT